MQAYKHFIHQIHICFGMFMKGVKEVRLLGRTCEITVTPSDQSGVIQVTLVIPADITITTGNFSLSKKRVKCPNCCQI